jgi:hypothetical protein
MLEGENTLGLILADGYYKPSFMWRYDSWQHEGVRRVLGLLHLTYEDGTVETIPTDGTWLAADEPALLENSIYHGEHYDARLAEPWCHTRTEGYRPVLIIPVEGEALLPSPLPPTSRPAWDCTVPTARCSRPIPIRRRTRWCVP